MKTIGICMMTLLAFAAVSGKANSEPVPLAGGVMAFKSIQAKGEDAVEAARVFKKAMATQKDGEGYEACCYATQVVAGLKYYFLCFKKPAADAEKDAVSELTVADVWVAPGGEVKETNLVSLGGNKNIPGGFTPFRSLTEEDKKVFASVEDELKAGKYVPVCIRTQVVAGFVHSYFCTFQPAKEGAEPANAIVDICVNLENKASLKGVHTLSATEFIDRLSRSAKQR